MESRQLFENFSVAAAFLAVVNAALAQPCEPAWSNQFNSAGLDSYVWALTSFDDGSGLGPAIYAGGSFVKAGGITVNHIAQLDGTAWLPLDTGTDGVIFGLGVFDDGSGEGPSLFAGGTFTMAGGVVVNGVARWNGNAWSPLGTGLSSDTIAWAWSFAGFDDGSSDGPALYVGGHFTGAGSVTASHIARWDGVSWSPVGGELDNTVLALAVFDDGSGDGPALYAGGYFTEAGGVPASRIAKWDGVTWSPVGGGVDGAVWALAVFDDGNGPALYAAGSFMTAGGVPAVRIAKWDGQQWSSLGQGLDSQVEALVVFDDGSGNGPALYAGGHFSQAGSVIANNVAKWDGVAWSPLDSGTGGSVIAMATLNNGSAGSAALFVGGFLQLAGGIPTERIAQWDGTEWSGPSNGVSGQVYTLAAFDDAPGSGESLYIGGNFVAAGGSPAASIATWDGESWSPLGAGVDGWVGALEVFDDGTGTGPALFVGGAFSMAGDVAASSIARWDDDWSPLGAGIEGAVFELAVFDDGKEGPALYAGGDFSQAGGITAVNIAKWDGASWSPVGDGLWGPGFGVFDLISFDDGSGNGPALYAGGDFFGVYSPTSGVARWDGVSWRPLPGDPAGGVRALAAFDDGLGGGPALYVGGGFCIGGEGGPAICDLARWDGSAWSDVGFGTSPGFVLALGVYDDGTGGGPALYAAGRFSAAGNTPATNIASWNGTAWSPLGQGVGRFNDEETVYALTVFDDGLGGGASLFAGGSFYTAGGLNSRNIARWGGCAVSVPADLDGNGVVNVTDLLLLLGAWGPCPQPCPPTCSADIDADCTVGFFDLIILLSGWTQ